MAKTDLWTTPIAIVTYLTTELNSLANAARVIGAAIDNRTTRYKYMMLEHYVNTQLAARSAGAYVSIYLVSSVDATNYAYGAAALQPAACKLKCVMSLDAAVTARYCTIDCIEIPPLLFMLVLEQNTGQTYATLSNTLKYRLFSSSLE
jgi:hypothetical protein